LYADQKLLVNLGTIHFKIIYQKGSEIPADYLSQNVVNSIQIEDGQMEKAQDSEEWISDIKKWMLNSVPAHNENAKQYLNYYWANRLLLEDNLLCQNPIQRRTIKSLCSSAKSTK
jgi:hypothetical protein